MRNRVKQSHKQWSGTKQWKDKQAMKKNKEQNASKSIVHYPANLAPQLWHADTAPRQQLNDQAILIQSAAKDPFTIPTPKPSKFASQPQKP